MKILFTKTALGLLALGAVMSSCSKREQSQKTGITYNDKNNGGYERFRQSHPSPGPGLVPIEGGTFVMGGSADQDITYDYNNVRRRVTVPSFYMDETEVSNQDWLDYLHWINITFPQDRELYYNAVPDTLVWRHPLSYNEPYVDNYLRHPAFQDYPVVGVTWDQAQDYCSWRTDRTNENILRETGKMVAWKDMGKKGGGGDAGIAANGQPFNTDIYLNGQMTGAGIDGKKMMPNLSPNAQAGTGKGGKAVRPVRMEDGILKQAYRLPSEAEWEYAALALAGNTQFENIDDGKIYTWNGMGVRSAKKKTRGLIMANFKRGNGDNAGVGGYLNDKADITAPVRSYAPNDFGLYNMAGNVNEWVADTYRQTSFEEFEDFNPFRGNEFSNKRLADPSKGLYAKDKYGKPIKDPAHANKKLKYSELLALQQQNTVAQSANPNAPLATTPQTGSLPADSLLPKNSGKAYNPDARGEKDEVNKALYGTTTLVNDHSKVYKGGSWNDMAFWLNPATRRFMDQDEASAEVGFRCAMTLVGAPEINPNGKPHYPVKKAKPFKTR
ncbi:SUMF1/EgtB/PvdO family nonheme iron enzyme [Mucilaginibacter rubeus]|uniref:SUMF1/EgtB/PvdO family nonheme iron enzyme n=1 Tax=Mucilaginibacter rubeus TaxID=2027860 RepID=A0AAE6JHB4_9SPHI|nr:MULTISPECIES: SUMF1/EgtB/PvdO family nonheme iron enzyme [Mucilaginibacter]QEM05453.1 SUMF1/EgtB/PvdO family nonheme iron enzyme [Mucilaginibacter rubeus]QEM18038.1 SUMF1/EgtB/PvdO family nonheme iron enzyme [Mucilaginibacter gossypii]QTE45425.1 SUMF1/EgtB/PvdO family nonheme iron enzyme [Mucilaginibacter rubeus]QTE52022.1 SUMF1/EgtB/PvdO family nonheme iron enzyme [Mucilaginibacter rubeus]QTE57111.1 SUMF1/EgtB/PvdO family nonheme iron enzyme [Mucilaginibacter rubeus]